MSDQEDKRPPADLAICFVIAFGLPFLLLACFVLGVLKKLWE